MSDRSIHKVTACRSGTTSYGMDYECEYTITFDYLPGAKPILWPTDHADAGWPAEISFVSIDADVSEHGAFADLAMRDLVEWAKDWLDEHHDELVTQAEQDRQPDPDDARDRMIEDRELNRDNDN
jgi:hypothetical protein